jgi:hypothetical protein
MKQVCFIHDVPNDKFCSDNVPNEIILFRQCTKRAYSVQIMYQKSKFCSDNVQNEPILFRQCTKRTNLFRQCTKRANSVLMMYQMSTFCSGSIPNEQFLCFFVTNTLCVTKCQGQSCRHRGRIAINMDSKCDLVLY